MLTEAALVRRQSFSALQRAEIAEIVADVCAVYGGCVGFSALQRAEIAEIVLVIIDEAAFVKSFSALQRAEIAEIIDDEHWYSVGQLVSVLFNEPKLLKSSVLRNRDREGTPFQCSSTSRNC